MNKIIIQYCFLLIIAASNLTAQNPSSVQMENTEESGSNYSESRNMIKLNPLLFFRGDVPVYYEKSLTDKIALEAGVGFTLIDYFNYSYLIDGYDYKENDKLGYSVLLGLRYYASDYSYMQEGFYFGFNVRYQSYKSDFISIEDIAYKGSNNSANLDVRLHIGYLYMWEENFFIEPYLAFGLRNKSFQEITFDDASQLYSTSSQTIQNPIFSLGFKFGIAF